MNEPQAPVAGDLTKIGNTVIPKEGLTFEETQKAIETDPIFAEKFLISRKQISDILTIANKQTEKLTTKQAN
jgi:hypothetical protein